ncbi:hypothetical protein J4573_25545 [Actinomadura barringtoniae]|uniref:Uncharacterized protein n=1 Tax=Actinomadura barringtoniae TaxID=1427535 RepID=A0A939PCU6_9ACTN|nr:hypothetical protein [Actinomadura barringtoniae]MBO2450492.1 hypothetical protein [Actinomadura barringtoniae]
MSLETLARELSERGWTCIIRPDTALLRVTHHTLPMIGESVGIVHGWFENSSRRPLAPCDDVRGAAVELIALLQPFVTAAATLAAEREPR